MAGPKPITIEYVDPGDYEGPEPQPFAVVGAEPGGGGSDPIAIGDVTGLQAIITDLTDRIEELEGKVEALETDAG